MNLKSSNKVDVNRYELEIEVSPEDFNKEVDKIYDREKSKITIPGFRKGKAPRSFIEKYYGEKVFYEDAINALYPYALENAAKEAGLELVDDHIDFEMVKLSKEEGFIFKSKVTVMPEVNVENYKGIEIKKSKVSAVTKEDVEKEIKNVQEKNSRLINVEDGEAQMGNIVNIDFKGTIDSEVFDGGTADGVDLELGGKQFIEGFEEQVVGHKIGDEFDVRVTFPENYHAKDLANKDAVFHTKLNKIQQKELPEIDDEFVKDISEFDTLDEYKKDIEKRLTESRKHNAEHETESKLIEEFIKLIKAEIPDALIKSKMKDLVRDLEYKLQAQGMSIKDYAAFTGSTPEAVEETFRPQAINHVKLELGLKKVGQLENIEVSDDEVETEYQKIAESYKMNVEQIKNFVRKDDLTADIIKKKSLDVIKENCIEKD